MFKKILLSILTFLVIFQSSVVPAHAQIKWYDSSIFDWYTKVYDTRVSGQQEIFGERYTAAQVQWVIYSLIVVPMNMLFDSEFTACVLDAAKTSADITDCLSLPWLIERLLALKNLVSYVPTQSYFANNPNSENSSFVIASKIFNAENRDLSGIGYFERMVNKINLVPTAHAQQGFGYGALSVLQPLWGKARDISYGLMILVAIVMAFMIMLRTKISPQAVITVQSALPKLILAIILITFSYAIAGLMVDLVYVVIGIAATVLAGDGVTTDVAQLYKVMTDGPGGAGVFGIMMGYTGIFPIGFMIALMGAGGSNLFGALFGTVFGAIFAFIAFFIVAFVMFFAFIKAIFMLIKTLVSVYLSVIFAPFYILGGAISSSLGFGAWLKDLIANLAVFPAAGVLTVLAIDFMGESIRLSLGQMPEAVRNAMVDILALLGKPNLTPLASADGWVPPLLTFGANAAPLMLMFVSLSLITLIPKVSDMIKSFVSGRPFSYGSAIGEAFTGAAVGAAGAVGLPTKLQSMYENKLKPLPGIAKGVGSFFKRK